MQNSNPIQPVNARSEPLVDPWMIAVWPGMGAVAPGAGGFLVNALNAKLETTLETGEFHTTNFVNVIDGVVNPGRPPRSMFFVWKDPAERHDLLFLIGEGQPDVDSPEYCDVVLDYAQSRGVSRVFTFAAMATKLNPKADPRVFGAVTDAELFDEMEAHGVEPLANGRIGGLNGVFLGAAAQRDLEGVCLMGELPFYAANLPNPKSALAVLRAFTDMTEIHVDLSDVAIQAEQMEPKLLELHERIASTRLGEDELDEDSWEDEYEADDDIDESERAVIEMLFDKAEADLTQADSLKAELDRLEVFDEYEDRFLDLFRNAG